VTFARASVESSLARRVLGIRIRSHAARSRRSMCEAARSLAARSLARSIYVYLILRNDEESVRARVRARARACIRQTPNRVSAPKKSCCAETVFSNARDQFLPPCFLHLPPPPPPPHPSLFNELVPARITPHVATWTLRDAGLVSRVSLIRKTIGISRWRLRRKRNG
jgi:hypothetical protein